MTDPQSTPLPIRAANAPVHSALNSMALLNRSDALPALPRWVHTVAAALSPEQTRVNQLLLGALRHALAPEGNPPDVPAYLAALLAEDANDVAERALRRTADMAARQPNIAPPSTDELAQDSARYIALARQIPGLSADDALHAEAWHLLREPEALQRLAVTHLEWLWEQHLAGVYAADERRITAGRQMLGQNVARANWKGSITPDTLTALLDITPIAGAAEIALVATPHVGRYVQWFLADSTCWLFLDAARHAPALFRTTPISRAELVQRFAALADSTTMAILELFANQDEITAADVIEQFSLSQAGASRALRQLGPFLTEHRGRGASKYYVFSPSQIEALFHTVRDVLAGRSAEATPQAEPNALDRFLDNQGRLAQWPARERDRLLVLQFLLHAFEPGQTYTEKEVNEALQQRLAFEDVASMRRALYDWRMLGRERDGSRYWRIDKHHTEGETP